VYAYCNNLLIKKLSKNKNITVINIVDSLSTLYNKNNFFQNILLLKSIAIGKKEGNFSLQYELSYFLDDATDKSAVEYANNLLKSAERVHQEFIYSGLPKFNENIGSRYSIKFENSFIFNKGRQRIAPVID